MEEVNNIRNSIIKMINSGITQNGLYRTLNHDQITNVKNYDWINNPSDLIRAKANVMVMNYKNNLYAITINSEKSYPFYKL